MAGKRRTCGKVLVVDDTAEIRDLLTILLGEEGYEVISARDGHEAVALLSDMVPQLVLLDLAMPRMDGVAVLRWMATHRHKRDIPVIVLSATSIRVPPEARGQITLVLGKPFDVGELLKEVNGVLRNPDKRTLDRKASAYALAPAT